ncbi:uncharacterized protein AMSG_06186 [Thecamonas trahens ATCC 50062]|uniref:SbsA Ig-like domain-containing protein n=1 Tax=Thecamonas trahens ATCC 50062 TaxID=461836 RepID=A0A0L0DC15_THETB|nr:hypothetical protein AMSG_06186 [Thecamonas trahens ATCC 50062]KNC49889.1 hypothetical protein AMSG_06186 [Thecamonas trahens ATCC 50062]|eukprot:XP_013757371.1 hypothetical protein AMSG_06186 [Thecamonas trahens ATCC 50062]
MDATPTLSVALVVVLVLAVGVVGQPPARNFVVDILSPSPHLEGSVTELETWFSDGECSDGHEVKITVTAGPNSKVGTSSTGPWLGSLDLAGFSVFPDTPPGSGARVFVLHDNLDNIDSGSRNEFIKFADPLWVGAPPPGPAPPSHCFFVRAPGLTGPGRSDASVPINVVDDDVAEVLISGLPATKLTIPEGSSSSFSVWLGSEPSSGSVDVKVVVAGPAISPQQLAFTSPPGPPLHTLTFTTANYMNPQVVTLYAVEDNIDADPYDFDLKLEPTGAAEYGPMQDKAIAGKYTLGNNDVANIVISAVSASSTPENGADITYTIVLATRPLGDVTVSLASDDTSECSVTPSLLFTPANYIVPQQVVISPQIDNVDDGPQSCSIRHNVTSDIDVKYDNFVLADITVTIADVDTAAVLFSTFSPSDIITESTSTSTTVQLGSRPLGTVNVSLSSSDVGEAEILPPWLVFTASDWNTPQPVTVFGVDDFVVDGTQAVTISFGPVSSSDVLEPYQGLPAVTDEVTVQNVDVPAVLVGVAGIPTNQLLEDGPVVVLTVELGVAPVPDVLVNVSVSVNDTIHASISPSVVSFTNADWNVKQNVVLSPIDNERAEDNVGIVVSIENTVSDSSVYHNVQPTPSQMPFDFINDDIASVVVECVSWPASVAEGASFEFSASLATEPSADVDVAFALDAPGSQAVISPSAATLLASEWRRPANFTVSVVEETVFDLTTSVTVSMASAVSADEFYQGLGPSAVGASFPYTFSAIDNEVQTSVVSIAPSAVATKLSSIRIQFDNPILPLYQSSMEAAFSLTDTTADGIVPVSLSWQSATELVALPVSPMIKNRQYAVLVNASVAESMTGLVDGTAAFRVVELLAFFEPSDGATGVELDADVVAIYAVRADVSDVPANRIAGVWSWSENGNVARFTPASPLEDTVTYNLVFGANVTTVVTTDLPDLLQLGRTLTYSFTTAVIPPQVEAMTPVDDAVGVALESTVVIEFDEVIDRAASANSVVLRYDSDGDDVGDTAVSAVETWTSGASGEVLTLTPVSALVGDVVHEVVVQSVFDVPGNAIAPVTFRFRTKDLAAPQVVGHTPQSGVGSVEVDSVVEITFSEAMNQQTTTAAVRLYAVPLDGTDRVRIDQVSPVWLSESLLQLTPDAELDAVARYMVEIVTDATDLSGNSLASVYSFSFRTVCGEAMYAEAGTGECVCGLGLYGPPNGPCVTCPPNGECLGGRSSPFPQAGFTSSPNNPLLFQPCVPREACLRNNTCATGYQGSSCAECSKGTPRYYRLSSRCVKCPDDAWMRWSAFSLVVVLAAGGLLGGLAYFSRSMVKSGIKKYRKSWASRMAVVSIGLNFWQIIAVMASFKLRWPSAVLKVFDFFSVLNFNVDLLATDCSVEYPYAFKWGVTMAAPLLLGTVYIALVLFSRLLCSVVSRRHRGIPWWLVGTSMVTVASFAYMFLSAKAVEFFDCTQQADGRYLLDADPSLECYQPWWMDMLPAGIAAVVVYVMGIPATFLLLILKYRSSLEDTKSAGFRVFGIISSRFRPSLAWYELIVIMRKLFIAVAMMTFSESPPVQAMIAQLALLVALAVQQRYVPFNSVACNMVESALLFASLVVLVFGQVFYTQQSNMLGYVTIAIIIACSAAVFVVAPEKGSTPEDAVALDLFAGAHDHHPGVSLAMQKRLTQSVAGASLPRPHYSEGGKLSRQVSDKSSPSLAASSSQPIRANASIFSTHGGIVVGKTSDELGLAAANLEATGAELCLELSNLELVDGFSGTSGDARYGGGPSSASSPSLSSSVGGGGGRTPASRSAT